MGSGVALDLELTVDIWERSGQVYGGRVRRQQASSGLSRQLLTDFVVGAHAGKTCTALTALDPQHDRLGFAGLSVIMPS